VKEEGLPLKVWNNCRIGMVVMSMEDSSKAAVIFGDVLNVGIKFVSISNCWRKMNETLLD
jgi:hypothetical protein